MREVIEYYGLGILEIISALAMLGILFTLFASSGLLNNIVADYMSSLGG